MKRADKKNNIEYKKNCEESSTSSKLEIDTMENECNIHTSNHESKKDYILNVVMWDNNLKGQYHESDTAPLAKLSLDNHLKTVKEIEKKKTKGDKRLDEPYTQVLSNDFDEALN